MKLHYIACGFLTLVASCASTSMDNTARADAALAHEFDMEMTGNDDVDNILIAAEIILEVFKGQLADNAYKDAFPQLDAFGGMVNNELEAEGIDPSSANQAQKEAASKRVVSALEPEAKAKMDAASKAVETWSSRVGDKLKARLAEEGAKKFGAADLQRLVSNTEQLQAIGGDYFTTAVLVKNIKDHAGQALENLSLQADLDAAVELYIAGGGDL